MESLHWTIRTIRTALAADEIRLAMSFVTDGMDAVSKRLCKMSAMHLAWHRFIPLFVCLLCPLVACGDDDAPQDAAVDTSTEDAASDAAETDAGSDAPDAFTRLPPPSCAPLPPVDPPACGSGPVGRGSLIPGPADEGYDETLAAKALTYERGFHAIHALHTGVNTEVNVAEEAHRELVRRFLQEEDGWDFSASAGADIDTMVTWRKVAGAYGGAGAAADAYRYAVLRDEGAACEDIERARGHVVEALHALHRATAITGTIGIVARGYQRSDVPGGGRETTPLQDDMGNPLPEEKDNGTWREDVSGDYENYQWEDSCSRDMLIGWVLGMASVWEVISLDPTFDDTVKTRLAEDAAAIARMLMQVGDMGYDLEIHDADGRLTFHAYLHEEAIDRAYAPGIRINAQHAIMSVGIIAALARISGDEEVASYLYNDLFRQRALHRLIRQHAGLVDFGVVTNFSNYNMMFNGAWLASRFVCDEDALAEIQAGITGDLYGMPDEMRHPSEIGNSFYDFVYLGARTGATAFSPMNRDAVDGDALSRSLDTLAQFESPPYWDTGRINCDEAELTAGSCTAIDGMTTITLHENPGRGDHPVAAHPVPMRLRPESNFHWRSDPYRVNGSGSGEELLPGVDFRLAYWMGRYLR